MGKEHKAVKMCQEGGVMVACIDWLSHTTMSRWAKLTYLCLLLLLGSSPGSIVF